MAFYMSAGVCTQVQTGPRVCHHLPSSRKRTFNLNVTFRAGLCKEVPLSQSELCAFIPASVTLNRKLPFFYQPVNCLLPKKEKVVTTLHTQALCLYNRAG